MKEQEPKRPSWEEFWSYLKREGKGHTEFRLVLYENKTAYIHVMNRDSESFNFELPKIDWDEAERRASFELSPDWTEEEYEWASDLTKELRYDSNLGTDGKKRVIAHLRKWISRVSGETPKPDLETLQARTIFLEGIILANERPKAEQSTPHTHDLTLTQKRYSDGTIEYFEAGEFISRDFLRGRTKRVQELTGEAKTPDLTLKLTPEIKLEDGKFILLLNGEKWVKELSGGSVPTPDPPILRKMFGLITNIRNVAGEEYKCWRDEVIEEFREHVKSRTVPTPSDEEIEAEIQKLPYTKHLDDGQFNDGVIHGFEMGAKWLRGRLSPEQNFGKDGDKG